MKENSINETIKIIERKIKEAEHYSDITGLYLTLDEELRNALMNILLDYKKVLKENEELKIKNNAIKRESEAYAENMIRLDNELNLEKEKSKYEWIRRNCLSQELVNKLYIPIQKVKDKIKDLKMSGGSDGKDNIENTARELVVEVLQDILDESKEK